MARVSVGLPTYNGAETIRECLLSLQAQTFEDFDVVISDNGSTDGTSDICADFCRQDNRFHHLRFKDTIPADANFVRVRDSTEGPYFMWRADDDLADPDHLRGLVAALDRNPAAKLAVAPILRIIDDSVRRETLYALPELPKADRVNRIIAVLLGCHPSWFYGLWRRGVVTADWDWVVNAYRFLWASDHLAMLPAIFDDAVELVPTARFIQRIRRVPSYHLPPDRLLVARARYKAMAYELLDQRDFSAEERRRLNRALSEHLDKRVAPLMRNVRRVIKQKIARALGFAK